MLTKQKFRLPDIFLGALLAVAIFAMGMLFSSHRPQENQNIRQSSETSKGEAAKVGAEERIADYTYWLAWLTGILAVSTVGLWVRYLFHFATRTRDG
jgi:ABC-type Fe3+ transport system permease subunit